MVGMPLGKSLREKGLFSLALRTHRAVLSIAASRLTLRMIYLNSALADHLFLPFRNTVWRNSRTPGALLMQLLQLHCFKVSSFAGRATLLDFLQRIPLRSTDGHSW